jgi:hypothetical protein
MTTPWEQLTDEQWTRLKHWAGLTPEQIEELLRQFSESEQFQANIQRALQMVTDEWAKGVEAIAEALEKDMNDINARLDRIEAHLFRESR